MSDERHTGQRRNRRPQMNPVRTASIGLALLLAALAVSAPVASQSEAQPITGATLALSAGTWVDTSSGPTIEFTVDEGWYLDGAPLEGVGIPLAHEDFHDAYLTITRFDGGVFPAPCATSDNAADFFESSGPNIEATAESLATHLEAHPYVEVTSTTPVEVGGWSGVSIDMRSEVPVECDPPWAWLWRLPIVEDFHLDADEDARVVALDVGDSVVVLAMEGFTGADPEVPIVDWDGFLDVAMGLVDSMKITPAGG